MTQRLFFDISRYMMSHRSSPLAIFSRGIRYIIYDIGLRKLFRQWVSIGIAFQRYIRSQPIHFDRNSVYIETKEGLYFRYIPSLDGGMFGAEFGNVWEKYELALLQKCTPQKGTFFDVGANIGWFSLHLARTKNAFVYGFEPNKDAYNIFLENIKKNSLQNNITCHQYAIGNKTQKVFLTNNNFFGNHIMTHREQNVQKKRVDMISLDGYISRNHISNIHSIKCDIEGAEYMVLQGAKKSIARFHPCVLLEIHEDLMHEYGFRPQDIFTFFSSLNYSYYYITEKGPRTPTGDIQKELQVAHNFFFYHIK